MSNNLGNKLTMAKNIKRYMGIKGVTAKEMCRVLNVPESTFSYWLNAKTYPRIDKIEMMANYFGISKPDLIEEPIAEKMFSDLQFFGEKEKPAGRTSELTEDEQYIIVCYRNAPYEIRDGVKRMLSAYEKKEESFSSAG